MDHLLFLVHRIPYPPNKGDKIRSYHMLRHLAQRYHVHLGTFIDDADDWQYVDTVKKLCGDTHFAALNPRLARVRSLGGMIGGRPLTLDYYQNKGMQSWVDQVIRKYSIQKILVFSSAMAQFVALGESSRRVVDFVDIDSDKWAQYAKTKNWPMNWIFQREAKQLLRYERKIAASFDASLFVSPQESELFKSLAPESSEKVGYFSNGVDADYFSPVHNLPNPYGANESTIVFTGAMDYWPNVDAVQWFVQEVLPAVLAARPDTVFYIVGSRPTAQVQALATYHGVRVTGAVPDVRPYLAHARVAVAPLRIARGIQNKVLEAMAMAKPVIVSSQALEGIDAVPGRDLVLAENANQFIDALVQQLSRGNPELGLCARNKVVAQYAWAANLASIDTLLDSTAMVPMQASHDSYSPSNPAEVVL